MEISKKKLSLNISANFIILFINGIIGFFLTSYLTNRLGIESYGFISLGIQLVSFLSLVTVSLNSLANRFITIEISNNNNIKANIYFNSVLWANFIIFLCLLFPVVYLLIHLENYLFISEDILSDVKVLYTFMFINFLVGLIFSTYSISTFSTNNLHLISFRKIESLFLKVIFLVLVFYFFGPTLYFWGISIFLSTFYVSFYDFYYFKKFLPFLRISFKYFDFKALTEILSSGIWNLFLSIGQILIRGLDLLIINRFIGIYEMGLLAVSKTIPDLIYAFLGAFLSSFMPSFTFFYAKNNIDRLRKNINDSIKVMGIFSNIPLSILLVYGMNFYSFWLPNQSSNQLHILTIFLSFHLIISGSIHPLFNVYSITNKLKINTILNISIGLINLLCIFLIINYTSFGIYGVSLVNSIVGTIFNLTFTPLYSAKLLNLKWNTFYSAIMKSILSFIIITLFSFAFKSFFEVSNFYVFTGLILVSTFFSFVINMLIIYNFDEIYTIVKIALKIVKIKMQ
jgi:O-antigen/teichoic acid export membrane protein